jgi:hypothetical protein
MIEVRRAAWSILVLVPACFDPGFSATRCGPGDSCPTGLTCRSDGMCRAREEASDANIEPDAAVDAAIDSFAGSCPSSYNASLPGPTKYRLILGGSVAWAHSDDCDDDLPGATHLVVLETMVELGAVSVLVDTTDGIANNRIWIGGVQERTAVMPADNWLGFDGAPLLNGWATGEPNDDTVEDGGEQFVQLERSRRYFADIEGPNLGGALCECDGKSVAPNARAAITSNRPPPP